MPRRRSPGVRVRSGDLVRVGCELFISLLGGTGRRSEVTPRGLLSMVDHAENVGALEADKGKMLRDAMREYAAGRTSTTLRQLMVEPIFVPENRHIDQMLAQFRTAKLNIAVVLDEYGGLAGIVTMEDLVEEILGEIYDENEQHEREKIIRASEYTFILAADVPIYVVNESVDVELPQSRTAQNLSGYLADCAGHIPAPGEIFETPAGRFEVITTSRRHIVSVRFHRRRMHHRTEIPTGLVMSAGCEYFPQAFSSDGL